MIAKLTSWKIATIAWAAMVCLSGCQTISSWLPQHDKVAEARQNSDARDSALSATVTPAQKINVQLAVAQSAEDENQLDPAAKIYLEITKKDSHCIAAYQHLGMLYAKKGDWERSRKYFDIAVKMDPKNVELQCDVGYCLYLQHHDKEAEVCLRHAIALETDNGRAHNDLGFVLVRLGKNMDALKEFSQAGCNEAQSHANLALALSMENRLADARAQYRIALAADPNCAIARSGLAALDSVDRNLMKANSVKEPELTARGPDNLF